MKNNPPPFDLTKKGDGLRVQSVKTPPPSASSESLFIVPKGPKLVLDPLFDRIYVTGPDVGKEEPGMAGGVYTGVTTPVGFVVVTAISVGPGATGIKPDDKLLVRRGAVETLVHDGNIYFYTFTGGVEGIVRA